MSSNVVKKRYPVPTNIYKKKSTPFAKLPYKVPSPQEIVHPFYKPGSVASLSLCMRETKPRLLDGQFVMPTVLKHPKTQDYKLVDGAIKFSTVKGVNMWLKSFIDHINIKAERPGLVLVAERYQVDPIRKFSKEAHQIILSEFNKATENGVNILDNSKLMDIIDNLTANMELGVFSEDILIFGLRNFSKTPREVSVILGTATELLDTRIDQMKSVGNIIFTCLSKLESMDGVENAVFGPQIDEFLTRVAKKFHMSSVFQHLSPVVNEKLFQFYVQHENLEDATFAINELINRNVKPEDTYIVKYLNVLEKKFAEIEPNNKHIIAYISNFSPIINSTNEPAIFGFLTRACRHSDILQNLLEIIGKSPEAKRIFFAINPEIINKIRQLSSSGIESSYRLSEYLDVLRRHFPEQLPAEVSWNIFNAFFEEGNFIMASRMIDEHNIALTPAIINDLISNNKKLRSRAMKMNSIGFTYNTLVEFIQKYFAPSIAKLKEENQTWINKFTG